MIERIARWFDRRVGGMPFVQDKLTKIFEESWTFLFGEIALYSFVVLVLTGTFLAFYFDPSHVETVYHGSYVPLQDVKMSAAYHSAIRLSFDVRAGLLIRQMHHWAANVFVAAIVVHLGRIFFTGAFRRPREVNWMIGVTMLLLALVEGYLGYSLLDDVLSGTGLRIGFSIVESIPVIGLWMATAIWGGLFPGEHIFNRLYISHVFIIPALFFLLIGLHLALIFRQTHTQFPGAGRREDNVVGVRTWPTYSAMSIGLFLLVTAAIAGLGGLVQINPVWFWGPYEPYLVGIGSQPDWYIGWLEGALRIFPPWEFRGWGYMVPNQFFPAVLFPLIVFGGLYAYPFIERVLTRDRAEHHLLDRPRHRPVRTAFGAGVFAFFFVLLVAGADDIIAFQLNVAITSFVWFLRIAAVTFPLFVAYVTYRLCKALVGEPAGAEAEEYEEVEEKLRHEEEEKQKQKAAASRRRRKRTLVGAAVAAVVAWAGRRRNPRLPL